MREVEPADRPVVIAFDEKRRLDLGTLVGDAGLAAPDDGVAAAAAAWTARRLALGSAVSVPDPPERLPYGLLAAIWA